jgi:hypothetical protein
MTTTAQLPVIPRTFTVLLIAFVAALMTQIIHELSHAVAMVVVGTGVDRVQLYAVLGRPVVDTNAQIIIAGCAAVVNIVLGLISVVAFYQVKTRYYLRLLLLYLSAYMLMAGFGYLFVDALFYNPDAPYLPDWQFVIQALGGGWDVRIPILIVGVVGLLGVFFWLPNAALRFVTDPTDKEIRQNEMRRLTLLPYIVVNIIFTVMGITHPFGAEGILFIILPYWFGYIALFWAFFIGGLWTDVKAQFADAERLSTPATPSWLMGLAGIWSVIALLMLMGLDF